MANIITGGAFRRLTMHRVMLPCAIATLTLVAQFQILAQPLESGSISSGREIAITICGNCHEIDHTMSPRLHLVPNFKTSPTNHRPRRFR